MIPAGMYSQKDYNLKASAIFGDAEETRRIQFSITDYRKQAEYFRTVEGTTDASLQDGKADSVGNILKATVVARDTKEYNSGTWSHVQLADYVGDYRKLWTNVHYFYRSENYVLTCVSIWDTGVEMDIDGFMNSLTKNSHFGSL